MPIYEYECTNCGRIEEVIQKFSDKPLAKCSQCKGKLHKLISHSSFHLKGTGWYVTDYAGKSGGNSSQNSTEAASTKTSDTKPSTTTAKKAADKTAD